ncbi:unnamed protein product [Symbiodinium sp. CCMP2592]|nr:unnamed protein product [Symbiodinium sp. CCMP2592]
MLMQNAETSSDLQETASGRIPACRRRQNRWANAKSLRGEAASAVLSRVRKQRLLCCLPEDCSMIMAEEGGCSKEVTSATRCLHTSVPLRHASDGACGEFLEFRISCILIHRCLLCLGLRQLRLPVAMIMHRCATQQSGRDLHRTGDSLEVDMDLHDSDGFRITTSGELRPRASKPRKYSLPLLNQFFIGVCDNPAQAKPAELEAPSMELLQTLRRKQRVKQKVY